MTRLIRTTAAAFVAVLSISFIGTNAAHAAGYGSPDGNSVSESSVTAGTKVRVVLRGFKPKSKVVLTFRSAVVLLGEFTADETGSVQTDVTVPEGIDPGDHHIVGEGVDAAGAAITPSLPVTVRGTSALAFTGMNTSSTLALAGLLITVGIAGTVAARRRIEPAYEARHRGSDSYRA